MVAADDGVQGTVNRMLKILLLEDHPMMVNAIQASVKSLAFKSKVYVANSLRDLDSGARFEGMGLPDFIIADMNVPGSAGLATLDYLRAQYPMTSILVFSQVDEPHFEAKALAHGATAFVSKSNLPKVFSQKLQSLLLEVVDLYQSPHRLDVLAESASNGVERLAMLTQQQKKVITALASGLNAQQIGLQLQLADQTIRAHLSDIYQHLGVKNRAQAVAFYWQWANE